MPRINTILVANRGEIAVRIMHTAQSLGYRTAAVYSEEDAGALHVQMADMSALIGPGPVKESYLVIENILKAAEEMGADAVHPAYGLLSENAAFARACAEAGLTFIGPTAETIDLMGNKAEARRRMMAAGVPCVPGYEGEDQSDVAFLTAARDIGFPVMVKAVAGGGGRGMRLVNSEEYLPDALATARSEAESAFGSGELILEKAIVRPRHVEFQVFADQQGNTIHLGERDCSIQRRHQKVIEEAPCPVMKENLRATMGAAAVDAARSIGYRSAGTVEFLLDDDSCFYFLEMNTRLQVEHPVTEMITGLDLVALQIQVAEGRPLGLVQDDINFSGHAIEARLYAEDTSNDFLPATGTITRWLPASGDGIRVDGGVASGFSVSPFYDPMIAKVAAHGENRNIARRRLARALEQTVVFGLTTNKPFLIDCLEDEVFADGGATTAFIDERFAADDLSRTEPGFDLAAVASVLQFVADRKNAVARSLGLSRELLNWSGSGALVSRYKYAVGKATFDLAVSPTGEATFRVTDDRQSADIAIIILDDGRAKLIVDGCPQVIFFHHDGRSVFVSANGHDYRFDNMPIGSRWGEEVVDGSRVAAPMHGKILKVSVAPGDTVSKGDRLLVLEAMKMQHEITSDADGTVATVLHKAGAQVATGDHLIKITVAEE